MKLWEVIKALTEDPTKKFVLDVGDRIYTLSAEKGGFSNFFNLSAINGKGANISKLDSGQFDGNFVTDGDDWQPVRQPVTWQKGIQACADGKRVWCEFHNQSWSVPELVANPLYLNKALDIGKWYVEDQVKLWEAMKLLEEDPSRKFEYQDNRKKWLLYADEACYDNLVFYMLDCWDSKGELRTGDGFGSLHDNLATSDNWQPVKRPVNWYVED
jgi:hypothetical protein